MARTERRLLRHKATGMVIYESDGLIGNTDYEPVASPAEEAEPVPAPMPEVSFDVRPRGRKVATGVPDGADAQ